MDEQYLRQVVIDLRAMREPVTPKTNSNREYLEYSVAISAINWILENGKH